MNRREFLRSATALVAVATLPAWAASKVMAGVDMASGPSQTAIATFTNGKWQGFRWVEPYNGPDLGPVVKELTRRMTANMPDYSHSSLGRPLIASRRKIG